MITNDYKSTLSLIEGCTNPQAYSFIQWNLIGICIQYINIYFTLI